MDTTLARNIAALDTSVREQLRGNAAFLRNIHTNFDLTLNRPGFLRAVSAVEVAGTPKVLRDAELTRQCIEGYAPLMLLARKIVVQGFLDYRPGPAVALIRYRPGYALWWCPSGVNFASRWGRNMILRAFADMLRREAFRCRALVSAYAFTSGTTAYANDFEELFIAYVTGERGWIENLVERYGEANVVSRFDDLRIAMEFVKAQ